MGEHLDIDRLLEDWDYDPQSISVRLVEGSDGRDLIQMRIDMGLLQMETTGRPDGARPGGFDTMYHNLLGEELRWGDEMSLTQEHCAAIDREFVQFYHRRICWLALRMYREAASDADHTLALMDLCRRLSSDANWIASHEQYRPFVLFHRTQAEALAILEAGEHKAPEAIKAINAGIRRIQDAYIQYDADDELEDSELIARLGELRESFRETFRVGKTLEERLDEAIRCEKYELAATLRDQIAARRSRHA